MSATSGGGGSVSEGSDAGESSQSTMSVGDSPSTSFPTKHADNVTKITLSEEHVPGIQAEITSSKMNLTLDERQQNDGVVNMAFDYEEGTNRGDMDFKSINGTEKRDKVPEAVNLELVNMVPYSNGNGTSYGVPVNGIPGIPVKKDSEQVDMSTPYDEYFVPVNEHKKYMRGEKLYVTKDKRRPTSWRRCLSWIVACTVISVVLIVAILAGTGVILFQEPNLVKQASIGRNFAGSNLTPLVTQMSSVTPITTNDGPMPLPTTDMTNMYVPRSIESQLIIDNLDFDPALQDTNSSEYQQFSTAMEDQLKMILFDKETLEFGASDVGLRVVNISRDPFKVNYRIGWNYKQGVHNPPEPIKMEDVKRRLVESLARNQGYIDKYHIDKEGIKVEHVINTCQMENGGCSHICYYNYLTQLFTCTCPTNLVLDSSRKNCVEWSEHSEQDFASVPTRDDYSGVSYETAEGQGNRAHEDNFHAHLEHGQENDPRHLEHQYEGVANPEPTPEPGFKDHLDGEHHKEHEIEPAPEPTAEPAPEPTAEPAPEPAPEPTPEPAAEPSPNQDHDSHLHAEVHPDPSSNHKISHSDTEAKAEPTAESVEHEQDGKEHAVDHVSGQIFDPNHHELAPEPTAEPSPESIEHKEHSSGQSSDHESALEPTPEPEVKDHESVPEPTPEPSSDNDEKLHSSSGSNMQNHHVHEVHEHPGTTLLPHVNREHSEMDSTATPQLGSNHDELTHSVPYLEQILINDSISHPTEHPESKHHFSVLSESDQNKESNSETGGHHVPPLEDILIRESNQNSKEHESNSDVRTVHDQDSLANVELTASGEPVIEEIIVHKPGSEETGGSNMNRGHTEHGVHDTTESEHDSASKSLMFGGEEVGHSHENSSEHPVLKAGQPDESSMHTFQQSGFRPQIVEAQGFEEITESPKIIEYNSAKPSDTEMKKDGSTDSIGDLDLEHIRGTENSYQTTVKNTNENGRGDGSDSTEHPQLGINGQSGTEHGTVMPDSDDKPGTEQVGTESPKVPYDSISGTTIHPDSYNAQEVIENTSNMNENQSQTRNLSELGQEGNAKSDEKPESEIHGTEQPVIVKEVMSVVDPSINDTAFHIKQIEDSNEKSKEKDGKIDNEASTENILSNDGSDHKKTDAAGTQIVTGDVTTTMPIHHDQLSREMVENKIKNKFSKEKKDDGTYDASRKPEQYSSNKTVDSEHNEEEVNGTASEELSNNIKDEGGDNEEFNTLLDKGYKNKEEHSGEGKEAAISKYPSKQSLLKGDKKKLKDFIKGDKTDTDKKIGGEGTIKPAVTPEDFILQKHVNGHENTYDLDYRFPNEHTTKHDADVTDVDSHHIEEVPGVLFKPVGIENHDFSVLQTAAPDFRAETVYPGGVQDTETNKPDSKTKAIDSKDGETKLDKEFPKFDKDYKYEKQKGSKKKELKKKGGSKDGKNVELDDGRKYYPDSFGKDDGFGKDFEVLSPETHYLVKDLPETTMNPSFETVTENHETRNVPGGINPVTGVKEHVTEISENEAKIGFDSHETTTEMKTNNNADNREVNFGPVLFSNVDKMDKIESDLGQTTIVPGQGDGETYVRTGAVEQSVPMDGGMKTHEGDHIEYLAKSAPKDEEVISHPEKTGYAVTEHLDQSTAKDGGESSHLSSQHEGETSIADQSGRLVNNEQTEASRGTAFDGKLPGMVNFSDAKNFPSGSDSSVTYTTGQGGSLQGNSSGILGTVFNGTPQDTLHTSEARFGENDGAHNYSFAVYESTSNVPETIYDGSFISQKSSSVFGTVNSTTAHPTIVVHGQSGSLQDGHEMRFGNSTLYTLGNSSVITSSGVFNRTLNPDGHSFSFRNYSLTFPNGTAVHPTIVVRGQSGALQDGHESRFNSTSFHTFVPSSGFSRTNFTNFGGQTSFGNSAVYRIENSSLPGAIFDGHFNSQDDNYQMFTNSSGTYVYRNSSTQPSFIIKGQSGDFGNSVAYILGNGTRSSFYSNSTGPQRTHHVVFRNETVFAVGNGTGSSGPAVEIQEVTVLPREVESNESFQFTHDMTPSSFSSGTAYKVNNYFGYISKCAAGQFQCTNGTSKRGSACISLSSKCDSINDCSDGSDEAGCIEKGCPGNFQCSDGTCLKRHLVCNGIVDCSDGSDEKQCDLWKCEFDEFQCPSGRCIPVVWQCDNKPDCDNHTDEYRCQTSCGNDEYLCPEGWCIPLTYKCNGIKECSNGEDEQLCGCSLDEFKCQSGGCVSKNQVCNGLDDCPDRSDEWGCVKLEPDSNLLKIRTASGDYEPVCADNWSVQRSDDVCASLGYSSSVPIENDNTSSITTEKSFYILKNDTTEVSNNKKFLVNLIRSNETCSSGKLVEISCQEFSCGSRSMTDSSSVEARLVGGMSATAGQWPSVALLYNIRNFHSCTANVLTPRWVLASYNCLKMGNKYLNEQDWKLFGGSTVFEVEKENAETRQITSIIPYPQVKFNQFLFSNDLALVELDRPLQFSSNLGAVCLPEQEIQPRQICVSAGWGMNTPEDKSIKQQLQYLPVPTMNLTECNSTDHYSGFITEDKICAGYNAAEKSLCYNEEGAPLMCVNDRGEWELQGVLSYHSNCGRGSHPSIFSSIIPVRNWIKQTIGNSFERKATTVAKR